MAEANPRLLVTAPGWKIVRADEFEPDSGELTFSDGSRRFDIHWYPAQMYDEYLRDRATVSTPEHGVLLGRRATTVDYTREEYATMLSPQGSVFIEVRGRLGSRGAYDEILDSLRPVDVDTWLECDAGQHSPSRSPVGGGRPDAARHTAAARIRCGRAAERRLDRRRIIARRQGRQRRLLCLGRELDRGACRG